MATTDDAVLADRLRRYRNHGMRERYHHDELGTNLKPTDLAAAIGLVQLSQADARNEQRRRNAHRLTEALEGYLVPTVPAGREHVWHQYTMRFPDERDAVAEGLRQRGVGSLAYYPVPVHRQRYLRGLLPDAARRSLPVTERLAEEVLSIPVRPDLTEMELEQVIDAVTASASRPSTDAASTARGDR